MTVRDLLSRLDSAELTEWQAHFALKAEDAARKEGKITTPAQMRAAFAHRVKRKD